MMAAVSLLLLLGPLGYCHGFSSLPTNAARSVFPPVQGLASSAASSTEQEEQVVLLRRQDYKEPANWISHVTLDFNFLQTKKTRVTSQLSIVPNDIHQLDSNDLILNGDSKTLDLVSISLLNENDEEEELTEGTDYQIYPDTMVISSSSLRGPCKVQIVVDLLEPSQSNGELSGLYQRGDMYCTHCEPSGFQQITYFADRPDNCATFERVRLEADKESYPILLSNGNLVDSGDASETDRHYAVFHDPHPKPAYLFALVVASDKNLGSIRDSYTTTSGKTVDLVLYAEHDQLPKLAFAMDTLKNAMKWDEDTFGLEYDLDTYNIVASQHFTLGAMENKGLNIFLTSLIATDPSCTTDVTYDLVEKTVAHEYFHNWSGNRVTVRDWFEFTLKEGLTVYRDQEFTRSVGQAARLDTVKILLEKQFAEDASTDRQPIRPESMQQQTANLDSLDSLASSTTYHKGAEVFRMFSTIVGQDGFRKGLKLYMRDNDGTGATCDDFLSAMVDANPQVDLTQFGRWFHTAGTPTVSYEYHFEKGRLELTLSQKLSHEEETGDETLLHIPIAVGLLDKETGDEVVPTTILNLKERKQTFCFDDLPSDVVPSLLRDFSAPVYLVPAMNESKSSPHGEIERLTFLAAYDTDDFNRWDAMQELFARYILALLAKDDASFTLEEYVLASFGRTLMDSTIDPSTKSYLLNLPTESILSRRLLDEPYDPIALLDARIHAMRTIAQSHEADLKALYDALTPKVLETHEITKAKSRATRSLRNRCLEYLCSQQQDAATLAKTHFETAICFTDQFVAFRQIASMSSPLRDDVALQFYQLALASESQSAQNTILNKWFQTQALADLSDALPRVQALTQHPNFKANNAGRFRSLITSFTRNTRSFHTKAGYQFIGSIISQMDRRSPILAVELSRKLTDYSRYDDERAEWMKSELFQLRSTMQPISQPLLATISKALPQDYRPVSATTTTKAPTLGVKTKKKKKNKKKKKPTKATKGFS